MPFSAEGKIRSVGVSSYESRHIDEIREFGRAMPAVNQVSLGFTRVHSQKLLGAREPLLSG